MLAIRIYNDIPFVWTITRDDQPEDLISSGAQVMLRDENGTRCKLEYSISGNQVIGVFRARYQKRLGAYTLELVENKNQAGMMTLDHANCWILVPHSYMEGGCPCPHLEINRPHLSGSLSLQLEP